MSIPPAFSNTLRHGLNTQAFVFAAGLVVFGLSATPVHANSLEEASQSFRSGQHARALEQVDRHLAANPRDVQGRFLKGVILSGQNRQADALAIFQKLTEDHPELPEPYNNLAVIYAQQKQYEKAKQALETAIRTHPAYATAHENLSDIYLRLASQAYGKALQTDGASTAAPSNASAAATATRLAMINDLNSPGGSGKVDAGKTATSKPVIAAVTPAKPAPAESSPAPPPKPEPAKPVPAAPDSLNSEITTALDGWLAAWSKKDVKAYLAYYAKDFQTPAGQTRPQWEADRTQRVGKPGKIEVSRDNALTINTEGADKARVYFRQHYKSAGFNSSSGKTLVLVKRNGSWLIQQERVGK
jgi:hypothetical protein